MKTFLAGGLIGLVAGMTYAQPSVQAPSNSPAALSLFAATGDIFDVYGELTGRNVLIPACLPKVEATLTPDLLADTNRTAAFIEAEFTKHGIAVVPDGKKFVRLLPVAWLNSSFAAQLARVQPPRTEREEIPPGHVNWSAADLEMALSYYSELTGTTVLRPAGLPYPPIRFRNQTSLTRAEFIYAIKVLLAFSSVAVIDDGDKFTQVVRIEQSPQIQARAPKPEKDADLIDPKRIPAFTYSSRVRTRAPVPPKPPSPPQQLMNTLTRSYTQAVTALFGPPAPPPKPEVDSLVALYARLMKTKAIPSKQFGKDPIYFEIKTPVTKAELLYAIEVTLAQCNLVIAATEQNSIQVVHFSELHKAKTNSPASIKR